MWAIRVGDIVRRCVDILGWLFGLAIWVGDLEWRLSWLFKLSN